MADRTRVGAMVVSFRMRGDRYYACDISIGRHRVASVVIDAPATDTNPTPEAVREVYEAWQRLRPAGRK